jgi:flagellar protein FliS
VIAGGKKSVDATDKSYGENVMGSNAHDAYLESRVESADPVQLVRMMYQGAIGSVREARNLLAKGDIAERSRAISKAHAILTELLVSLDHERGGEISMQLARLYDYMQRRLLEANLQQVDAPMVEVLGLLSTLKEAWDRLQPTAEAPEAPRNAWTPQPSGEVPPYSTGGWSL